LLGKIIVAAGALSIVIVLPLVLVSAFFCRRTLRGYPGSKQRSDAAPPNSTTVTILAHDGAVLSASWLQSSRTNGDCVVVLHGIGDSRLGVARFAPMLLNQGYSVLLPDSRAHGQSGGRFVTYGLLEKYDVIDWANWMKRAGYRKLYALGESLGGAVLIESAAIQPIFSAIVAESPYADFRQVSEYHVAASGRVPPVVARLIVAGTLTYAAWVYRLDLWRVSPVESIVRASTPILLIHGLDDTRTPPYNSVRLAEANPGNSLWLVPKAQHTEASLAEPEEFRKRVLSWFAQ
jgi:uncharacterized protein